jgi:DNA-directed RNA polymerase subunit M/transcription elongation factor TFIIS
MVEFCDRCGSFMQQSSSGYECPRCGLVRHEDMIEVKTAPEHKAEPVYVMSGVDSAIIVERACPECKNRKAYRSVNVSLGEHAGVNTDRSVEKFKCVKCGHQWVVN